MLKWQRLRPTGPGLVLVLIGLGGLGAVGLWCADTAPFTRSLGNELTNAGRIMGLVGGYLVAIQLFLMARIPWLDRAIGVRRKVRWHQANGRYVVVTLTCHAVLIIWGYASTAHRNVVGETGQLWAHYPDVLMATVALGLFVMVGVMSAMAIRKRVHYKTWHFIHLYVYLAIALAFSHSFANGAEFSRSLRDRVLWASLYVAAASSVFVFRMVLPASRALRSWSSSRQSALEEKSCVAQ